MKVDPHALRQWAAAERFAIVAEELVRCAINQHLEQGAPPPSPDIMDIAAERREEADKLFHQLFTDRRSTGPFTAGWDRLIR